MRDIKFRGQKMNTNEWVYGFLCSQGTIGTWEKKEHDIGHHFYKYAIIPESVGQFTGLKDKNGKEIYEGDIFIKASDTKININDMREVKSPFTATYVICFSCGKFIKTLVVQKNYWFGNLPANFDITNADGIVNCDIIGNIYETPELLK